MSRPQRRGLVIYVFVIYVLDDVRGASTKIPDGLQAHQQDIPSPTGMALLRQLLTVPPAFKHTSVQPSFVLALFLINVFLLY